MFISDYYDDGSVHVSKEELSKYSPAQRQTHPPLWGLSPMLPSVRCEMRWGEDSVWWMVHKKNEMTSYLKLLSRRSSKDTEENRNTRSW
jgi:hypothetical protein